MVSRVAAPLAALLVLAVLAPVVRAQENGGELVFVVPAESPSFDAHREESFLNNQLDTVWLAE
jgi:hypothetical protein